MQTHKPIEPNPQLVVSSRFVPGYAVCDDGNGKVRIELSISGSIFRCALSEQLEHDGRFSVIRQRFLENVK